MAATGCSLQYLGVPEYPVDSSFSFSDLNSMFKESTGVGNLFQLVKVRGAPSNPYMLFLMAPLFSRRTGR